MKTTVIHHSADYDGLFCREIARKFLPDAELIGWDFGDAPISLNVFEASERIYIMDLPVDRPFGATDAGFLERVWQEKLIWIDHHKSSIETHPKEIPGYRIDGVAACRLAWQWFTHRDNSGGGTMFPLPEFQHFKSRSITEPYSVQLAGEYDVWDHRDDLAIPFQFGLDAQKVINWLSILVSGIQGNSETLRIAHEGKACRNCYAKRDADIMLKRSFVSEFEGLKLLCINTARCNSQTFEARDIPETGHDALCGFWFDGRQWNVSLYHARHRTDLDLSEIAKKHGGGGHRGACGFRTNVDMAGNLRMGLV